MLHLAHRSLFQATIHIHWHSHVQLCSKKFHFHRASQYTQCFFFNFKALISFKPLLHWTCSSNDPNYSLGGDPRTDHRNENASWFLKVTDQKLYGHWIFWVFVAFVELRSIIDHTDRTEQKAINAYSISSTNS